MSNGRCSIIRVKGLGPHLRAIDLMDDYEIINQEPLTLCIQIFTDETKDIQVGQGPDRVPLMNGYIIVLIHRKNRAQALPRPVPNADYGIRF